MRFLFVEKKLFFPQEHANHANEEAAWFARRSTGWLRRKRGGEGVAACGRWGGGEERIWKWTVWEIIRSQPVFHLRNICAYRPSETVKNTATSTGWCTLAEGSRSAVHKAVALELPRVKRLSEIMGPPRR